MINLLKADLFRMRKSKTFKISLAIMMIIITGFIFLYFSKEDYLMVNAAFRNDRFYGFYIGSVSENRDYLNYFRSSLGFVIFICILMLFIVGDAIISRYNNGIIKNTIAYGHNRYKIYLSNLISIIIATTVIIIATIGLSMIILCTLFKINRSITSEEVMTILKVCGVLILIISSMISIYSLLSTIIKSKAIVATIGALFMTLVSALLFDSISELMKSKIPIYMLLDICGNPVNSEILNTFAINSIIIIFISTILGCVIFNNQDIK